jgi:plastocyanin
MKQLATTAFLFSLFLDFGVTQTVMVGASGFVFSPDTVTAGVGSVIDFVITSGHSVAQSTFQSPCQAIGGTGIYSGFPSNNAVFRVTVNSSDPIWLYCSAPGHCQGGMVMVINPP